MSNYILSSDAEEDIQNIYLYTAIHYGVDQAELYAKNFFSSFDLIAQNPDIGRDCSYIITGYRRLEINKHAIFYKKHSENVLIVRILHNKRDCLKILQ